MTAATTLQQAEDALAAHHVQCPTCQTGYSCIELIRLSGERDRLWRAQLDSLTSRRVR